MLEVGTAKLDSPLQASCSLILEGTEGTRVEKGMGRFVTHQQEPAHCGIVSVSLLHGLPAPGPQRN